MLEVIVFMTDAKNTNQTKLNDSKKSKSTIFGRVIVLFLLCIIGFMVWGFLQYQQEQAQAKKDAELAVVSREAVLQKIQSLNRLETIGFTIETVIASKKQGNWYNLWQDGHKGLFVVSGRVQAGIDLSELSKNNLTVDAQGKTKKVVLPSAKIFQVYLDQIEVYDYKKGLLGQQINHDVFNKMQTEAKKQVLLKACEADILKLANNSGQKQVQNLFDLVDVDIQIDVSDVLTCG